MESRSEITQATSTSTKREALGHVVQGSRQYDHARSGNDFARAHDHDVYRARRVHGVLRTGRFQVTVAKIADNEYRWTFGARKGGSSISYRPLLSLSYKRAAALIL
jgi:hypothetical protein